MSKTWRIWFIVLWFFFLWDVFWAARALWPPNVQLGGFGFFFFAGFTVYQWLMLLINRWMYRQQQSSKQRSADALERINRIWRPEDYR